MSNTVRPIAACVALFGLLASPTHATDGVIEINAARAVAGGVTSDDTPGYPVTISSSGSYRLSSNLQVPDENSGAIRITADHVTLDLNGFMIHCCTGDGDPCIPCADGTGIGIFATGVDVAIRNGTVANMAARGIVVETGTVDGVRVRGNKGAGIWLTSGLVTGCIVRNNESGIVLLGHTVASGNTVAGNAGSGIQVGESVVSYNVVGDNGGNGILVPAPNQGGMIAGNVVRANGGIGMNLVSAGYIHNTTSANTGMDLDSGVNTGGNVCAAALCPGTP
jgi:hypothetical protein